MADPRGGVRHVIPWKGNYLAPSAPASAAVHLVDGNERFLKWELLRRLWSPEFDRIDFVVSFVMRSGVRLLLGGLRDALDRGAHVRILTSDYLGITDADALAQLLDLADRGTAGSLTIRVFHDDATSFHPKAYLFRSSRGDVAAGFVGSNNLSESGLDGGVEWSVGVEQVAAMMRSFERLWDDRRSQVLTPQWLRTYRSRRRVPDHVVPIGVGIEPPSQPAVSRPIQRQALDALEATRLDGHRAGLVVMATGLGKTWVAAFDSARPQFRRVLFIAHREEILRQSRDAFRQVQPDADFGLYLGGEKQPNARVVFASIATLANRLHAFRPDEFDYVVVDEFHHAAARTYRRVIDHFTPAFLLGLTATPDRMDGADLLALCDDNLVFDCDLVEGIRIGDLCPFEYHGIKDLTDFAPVPWRNGRFDPEALAEAVETRARAEQAFDEWEERRGRRTLAFCASTSHADFMARFFAERGMQVAAVHSGVTSSPRSAAVERLRRGELDVIFAVDAFNEGLDVPAIDTVMMLRPTESPVVFLQQLGRGLRTEEGKERLTVIDLVGNHRSFLSRPRILLSLAGRGGPPSSRDVLEAMRTGDFGLPPGCSVRYDLEIVEMLRELVRLGASDLIAEYCRSYVDEHWQRPTAMQVFRAGLNPDQPRRAHRSWFAFLDHLGLLEDRERSALARGGEVLTRIETEPITKSYKLVTFRALLHDGRLRSGIPIADLASTAQRLVSGDPRLVEDTRGKELADPGGAPPDQWRAFWTRWPLQMLTGAGRRGASSEPLFRIVGDRFEPTFTVPPEDGDAFDDMVAELVDYRLGRYLLTRAPTSPSVVRAKLIHAGGRPILKLDRDRYPATPEGEVDFVADGSVFVGRFVKIALNVAMERNGGRDLSALLRSWFGPSAGQPGTSHFVELDRRSGEWVMRPARAETTPGEPGRNVSDAT